MLKIINIVDKVTCKQRNEQLSGHIIGSLGLVVGLIRRNKDDYEGILGYDKRKRG